MSFIRKIKRGNRVYLAEVESYRDDGKIRQRFIRYVGVSEESKPNDIRFYARDVEVRSVKVSGPILVMESVARELGLFELLGGLAEPILTLVFAHCMDYKSVRETEKWFETTDLQSVFSCDKMTENTLYNAVERLREYDTEWLQESIFENMQNLLGEDESGCIYDGTNTCLSGTRSDLANKGKDKEGVRGRRLIQIGLGVTRTKGIPIFHQVHNGNIHDSKMFKEAIYTFNNRGVKKGLMVYDRGTACIDSILRLSKTGWKSLAGLPMHGGVKSAISNMDFEKMQSFRNLVVQGGTELFVKSLPYQISDTKGKLLVLMNSSRKHVLSSERRLRINADKEVIKREPDEVSEELKKYFNCDGNINVHAVERAERYDGLSFLFTNAKLNISEAVSSYFAKDLIEQCFKMEKSILNLRPIRFSLDSNIKSHIMICYLALALITTLRCRLTNKGIFTNPSAVLKNLESIYKVYLTGRAKGKDGKKQQETLFNKVNTMTKHQSKVIRIIAPKLKM